ncbi:LuxR C-terminal-related transcriptional regulator [Streptomyces sp. NPDC090077]|uniref:LuxR C-terminal-related transcriptional regulator n=1 Tax=Streptomyces sp. NPDC090077 TaxID=3365938 RepID=UPI0037F8F079
MKERAMAAAPDTSPLTAVELSAYRRALRGEELPDGEPGLASLLARDILFPNTHEPGTYVPAPSRYLETQLNDAVLKALTDVTAALAAVPAHVRELEAEQQRHHYSPSPVGTLLLRTVPEVNAETIRTIQSAESEILTAQPGHRKPQVLKGALPRDLQAARRGVTVRTIYRNNGRTNPAQRDWVATMTRAGAQVRTLGEDFLRLIVVDRKHAFFEVFGDDGTIQQASAWYTRDRGVCAVLAAHFWQQWERADPWLPGDPEAGAVKGDEDATTSKIQRTIVRGIVAGKSHRQIGENLGLSERTVTAQVSKLREALGLETVPQLTFWWATSPERLLP